MSRVVVSNVTYANISVGVSITSTENSTNAVAANQLAVAATYVVPSVLLNAVQIVMLADTDLIGYNRFVSEYDFAVDYAALGFYKTTSESLHTADSATYVLFKKGLNELKVTTESKSFAVAKRLNDTVHPTDDFYGVSNADDDETMLFGKSLTDFKATSDVRVSSVSKARADTVAKSDVQKTSFGKGRTDSSATSDAKTVAIQKSLADSIHSGDEFNASALTDDGEVMVFGKSASDSFIKSDSVSLQPEKNFSDSATSGDYLWPFDLGKGIADTPITSESQQFDTSKPIADSAATGELLNKSPIKTVSDRLYYPKEGPSQYDTYATTYFGEQYVLEGFPAFGFAKTLTDTVITTDDFYGVANSDDDETMQFGKTLTDSFGKSDAAYALTGKALSDGFTKSDASTALVGKGLSDSAVSADTANKFAGKSLSDSFGKSDIVVNGVGKGLADGASTSETKAFAISKSLLDSVHPTDDFLGVANADDDEVMTFNKSIADSFTKSDVASLTPGKGLTDSVSKSDSGSLVWTDYWDIGYTVTTSGVYVGNSRTF